MVKAADPLLHVRGESKFVDDLPHPEGMLYARVMTSAIAHGRIVRMDASSAEKLPGVVNIFTCEDVPGENQIGNIIRDEVLLAEGEVHFIGQPVALVVGRSVEAARAAARAIAIEYDELPIVLDPREAYAKGMLIAPPRILQCGDVDAAWDLCDVVVSGTVASGGQEHIYMETQGSLATPTERGVHIVSSTQAPTAVQRIVSRVLGIPMHRIEVDVTRLGGAFGGKEDQATPWAVMAALAAFKIKKPVKLVLSRKEDILMTGKRHPYSSDFKIGLMRDGRIVAYQVMFYQNAGAAADLSTSILERSMLHATGSYHIPNVKIMAASCRTNLPPNTAFRGFGAPQAMYVMECAIYRAADEMGVNPSMIQEKNLLKDGDAFPCGMPAEHARARACWEELERKGDVKQLRKRVEDFNGSNALAKKGIAMMPICFGISFTSTFLNQAAALVHVYTDGSVGVSTAAVEMGQGVNEKLRGVAARVFSLDVERVKVESTNTARIANTSPTAASSGADMNGNATRLACIAILDRMKAAAVKKLGLQSADSVELKDGYVWADGKKTHVGWEELIGIMYLDRISLSAQAHYATPHIHYDRDAEKGSPFAYHVFGAALIEATVDCLRGTYSIDAAHIVHDFGASLDPLIDRGQAEGALMQGIGWMTLEELKYAPGGELLTDGMATYKVPDIHFVPREFAIHFLGGADNPAGLFNSKAIGEPPFMYGIGAYFALMNAMRAFKPDMEAFFDAPLTPEKVLMALYG